MVRKGEKGIKIFAPSSKIEKDEKGNSVKDEKGETKKTSFFVMVTGTRHKPDRGNPGLLRAPRPGGTPRPHHARITALLYGITAPRQSGQLVDSWCCFIGRPLVN